MMTVACRRRTLRAWARARSLASFCFLSAAFSLSWLAVSNSTFNVAKPWSSWFFKSLSEMVFASTCRA